LETLARIAVVFLVMAVLLGVPLLVFGDRFDVALAGEAGVA